jgi:hypothetical protein
MPEMTVKRLLDVAQFLLDLSKQRLAEAKSLNKMDETIQDVRSLINEVDLLKDGYDLVMAHLKEKGI